MAADKNVLICSSVARVQSVFDGGAHELLHIAVRLW